MSNLSNTLAETLSSELVELNDGDLIQVTRIKDRKHKTAPYFCIGKRGNAAFFDPFTQKKSFTEGLDVTSVFLQLNPVSLSLFWKLVSIRDPKTNVVELSNSTLNISDKNRIKKFLNELLSYQLVCRIKRGFILINPKAIIPEYGFYESVENRWMKLEMEHKAKASAHLDNSPKEVELSLSTAGVMDSFIDFDDEENETSFSSTLPQKLELTL